MDNKYLEKIAGFAAKLQATNTGKAMGDLSHVDNQSVLARLGSSKATHSYASGGKTQKLEGGFMGVGKKKVHVADGKTFQTGDSTLKTPLQDRLAAHKAGKAQAAAAAEASAKSSGARGILNKAVGMAKRNPIAAGAIGLGAAAAGAGAMSGGKKNDNQNYYQ